MSSNQEGCYAPVQVDNADPSLESLGMEDQTAQPPKRTRRVLAGIALTVGIAVIIVFIGAQVTQHHNALATDNVVGLAASTKAEDLDKEMATQLADIKKERAADWAQMKEMQKAENQRKARKLIQHMNKKSPDEVRKIVDDVVIKASTKAVQTKENQEESTKGLFRELKKRASKSQDPPWLTAAKDFREDKKALEALRTKQAGQASCVFASIQAAQYIATIAFGIDNSRTTCPNSKGLRHKLCAINALLVVSGISFLAAALASAASTCAETMNFEALCAASVTGVVSGFSQIAAAGIVIGEGCKPVQQFIKDNAKTGISLTGKRRLEEFQLPPPEYYQTGAVTAVKEEAPARRLFLGGDKQVTMGQCVTDITTLAWNVASIGLSIRGASITCANRIPDGPTDIIQNLLLKKALCSSDVNSILYNFGSIATFLQIATIHCGGGLNLQAICGAGLAGLLAASAAVGKAVSGWYATCNIGIKLNAAQKLLALAGNVGGNKKKHSNNDASLEEANAELGIDLARRLADGFANDPIGTMRQQRDEMWDAHGFNISYADARRLHGLEDPLEGLDGSEDPKDLWAKMGYDLDDPNPDWLVDLEAAANDNHEATDAFLRVMHPYLHEVDESIDEETQKKWPLWPSPFEEEKEEL